MATIFFVSPAAMQPIYDISIVIVTYNNRDILPRCLDSLSRSLSPYLSQLCIIDNNSTDGTAFYLRDSATWNTFSFKTVERVYNRENLGYTKGVNQGLRRCLGQIILLLNPDIFFRDNPFEVLITELEQEENVGVVSPQFRFLDDSVQPSCRRFPKKKDVLFEFLGLSRLFPRWVFFNTWRMPDFDHKVSADVAQPQGAFLLMRQDVLSTTGLLDESFPMFFSDVDWCFRVHQNGWRIRFMADVFVYHLKGASVKQRRAQMIISSHQSFITYFRKYDKTRFDRCITHFVHILLLVATPLRLIMNLNRL